MYFLVYGFRKLTVTSLEKKLLKSLSSCVSSFYWHLMLDWHIVSNNTKSNEEHSEYSDNIWAIHNQKNLEGERNAYAFSAWRMCSFASSIFDIFLRMVPSFSSAVEHDNEVMSVRCPELRSNPKSCSPLVKALCPHTDAETNLYTCRSSTPTVLDNSRDCEAHKRLSTRRLDLT